MALGGEEEVGFFADGDGGLGDAFVGLDGAVGFDVEHETADGADAGFGRELGEGELFREDEVAEEGEEKFIGWDGGHGLEEGW